MLEQFAFALLEAEHPFLHRSRGDQLVNGDLFVLADAVGPVAGLGLGGGVPPGVEVHDDVRSGQVQSGSSGLERDQEHGDGFVFLKTVDLGHAVLGGSVEVAKGQGGGFELRFEKLKDLHELGKDEHAVVAFQAGVKEFAKGIELGRLIGGEAFLEQAGIATGLAQAKELSEGLHAHRAFARSRIGQFVQFGFGGAPDFVVAGGLFLGQVEVENLFDLFGEFGRDFRFSAAQEIGGGFLEDALFVPNAFVSA